MSIKYLSGVWESSEARGGDLLVLLAIADHADENGMAYPSIKSIAKKARLHPDTVGNSIKHLESIGELQKMVGAGVDYGRGPTNRYGVILKPRGGKIPTGGQEIGDGGGERSPQTIIEPSVDIEQDLLKIEKLEELIYKAYPRHVAKPVALRAIRAAIKRCPGENMQQRQEWLLERTKAFATARHGQDAQFTAYPATWFNQSRFNDDPETWKTFLAARDRKPTAAPAAYAENGGFGETRQE